ncbi:MAG: hypothetical protein MSIBF_00605 [Candidatus Altiarchaeales archaeon IMC4]|nr:MAG: hypothetical protein MSIBF_00605 [Candidatus Altiarchaeales archaeon IMC4]
MKNEQMDNTKDNIKRNVQSRYLQVMMGLFLITVDIFLSYYNNDSNDSPGFLTLLGIIMVIYYGYEIIRYKRTGEIRIRIDELTELNRLRAIDVGFKFLTLSILVVMILSLEEKMGATETLYLIYAAFFVACLLFILFYYIIYGKLSK